MADGVARFGVLGPLVLERDSEYVALPTGRQRSLLALLLLGGGVPLSRDRLIDELWGERPPATAVSALHVHLSKLRELLDGLLLLEPSGYALEPGRFDLDAWQFDALVEKARQDPEQARSTLGEALALFRGEPLCDVACEGSVAGWRRALEDKRLQAIELRIDTDLAAGASGHLVAELDRLVGEHPFEERLWSQLMLALYRAERQADALDAFQRLRRLLAEELGLEPGEPLNRLHQQILERDPALQSPAPAPPAVAPARRASALPQPLTRLIGRERELAALAAMMADPDVRLITLAGPGGVGKTRLILELARRQEPQFADGAVFVRLEQLTEPALVAAEIASALARRDDSEAPNADGLASYLRERELLMVVDNFEHLLPAAVLIAELLAMAPRIKVLVSSRTVLRIRGEHLFEVEPLALPAGNDEEAVSQSAAVQLFLHCTLATNRGLEIDIELTGTVADICRAVDGLPLAIELAASRAGSLSPSQIAEQLAKPLSIGEYALRDLPDRQQTLQATIRWSYDLLPPGAQTVLRCASLFLGGFTAEALAAVADQQVQAQLDELLDASLVRRQVAADRFELLELVRAFALDELARGEREADIRARRREYFAAAVASAAAAFDGGGAPGELAAPLLADHANIRAALEDAIDSGDKESAVQLALGMRPLWLSGMLRQESQELVDRLLERFSIPGEQEIALLRAPAFLDYTPRAMTWHRRLAARAAELGDQEAVATATGNMFGLALNTQDREEMKRLRPELLALLTPETSAKATGWIHYFLALDAYVHGHYEAACEHATLSAESAEAVGHEFMLASAVGTRVMAQSARDGVMLQPDLVEALELMRRPSIPPLGAFALWLVARYAAGVAPDAAGRWLAHGERIVLALDSELWPESVLRDETLAVLGLDDLTPLLEAIPPLDHAAALDEAAAWLTERDPAEKSPRGALEVSAS